MSPSPSLRRLAASLGLAGLTALQGCGLSAVVAGTIVASSDGGSSSAALPPAPVVQSVSPGSGSHQGGITLTIDGANFSTSTADPPTVTVGGVTATDVDVQDASRLTCTLPASASAGAVSVSVTNPQGGTGTRSGAFTYLNALPAVQLGALASPQTQNIVFSVTLTDPESDPLDVELEYSVNGGPFAPLPTAQILSGGLDGLTSSPAGDVHNLTWDSRGTFPAQNAVAVVLRATPVDTTDGQTGTPDDSNAFDVINNTPVQLTLVQPADDAFDVAFGFSVTDPDATDPVSITAITFTSLNASATGPITIAAGQGAGPCPFSAAGVATTTVWDSLADLGFGNNHLVQVELTITDGTYTSTVTSAPFFVHNGPLSNQQTAAARLAPQGMALGDVASESRRFLIGPVTGAFVDGEGITASPSGARARIVRVASGSLVVDQETAAFTAGETLTGAFTSASATLTGVEAFSPLTDIVVANGATTGLPGQLSVMRANTAGFDAPVVTTAPDVPGPPVPGDLTNPFLSGYSHPTHCAILDTDGDGLLDLVAADSILLGGGFFVVDPVPFAQADAGSGYANVRAHQATLVVRQVGSGLDIAAGAWEPLQADRAAIAPHLRLPTQAATVYPQAATGDPGQDTLGWFTSGLVAADVDGPGSSNAADRADLVALMSVRQLGATPDARPCVLVRQVDGTGALGAPYYLDPTDLTGTAAATIAVADVTGDAHTAANGGLPGDGRDVPAGAPDIVVAISASTSLACYVQVDPTTSPPTWVSTNVPLAAYVPFTFPGDLTAIAAGDLNLDGVQDLVLLHAFTQRLVLLVHDRDPAAPATLLGHADAPGLLPFRVAGSIPLPEVVFNAPVVADVNGDGRPDILLPVGGPSELFVYTNSGTTAAPTPGGAPTPVFATAPVRFTTLFGPARVAVGDLDGDRRPDAAVATVGPTLAIFYQQSPGTLDKFVPVPTAIQPQGLDAGDVTGDGVPEVVVGCSGSNALQVFRRDPATTLALDATFNLNVYQSPSPPTVNVNVPSGVRIRDVRGDGTPNDIITCTLSSTEAFTPVGAFAWVQGGPLGASVAAVQTCSAFYTPYVDVGDFLFSGGVPDGIPDVALTSFAGLQLFRGQGGGAFAPPLQVNPFRFHIDIQVVDLDGDGYLDIVSTDNTVPRVMAYYNGGEPFGAGGLTYGQLPSFPVELDGLGISPAGHVQVGDLGAGPANDVVFNGFVTPGVGVLFQTGPRTFTAVQLAAGPDTGKMAIGDLNGDGRNDLVVPWGGENVVAVYYQNPSPTGPEDTLFGPVLYPTSNTPFSVAIVDVDGDGNNDLVVACRGASVLNVFKQR